MATTYEPIATTTTSGSTATITFSSIPSTYTDLRLVLWTKSISSSTWCRMYFNSDNAGTTYSNTYITGDGTTNTSSRTSNAANSLLGYPSNVTPNFILVDIFEYKNTSIQKTFLITDCEDGGAAGTIRYIAGCWRSTAAISSINIVLDSPRTFTDGTKATLFGITAA